MNPGGEGKMGDPKAKEAQKLDSWWLRILARKRVCGAWRAAGRAYSQEGEWAKAARAYRRAAELIPRSASYSTSHAYMMVLEMARSSIRDKAEARQYLDAPKSN